MTSPEECAMMVLSVVPQLMQGIRWEVRRERAADLSVPQFRTLIFIHRHEGSSLSRAAEHVGLSRPAMSKMIDGLVHRAYVDRRTSPSDRRLVRLDLTPKGKSVLGAALRAARARLAETLRPLRSCDRAIVVEALKTLREAFHMGQEEHPCPSRNG